MKTTHERMRDLLQRAIVLRRAEETGVECVNWPDWYVEVGTVLDSQASRRPAVPITLEDELATLSRQHATEIERIELLADLVRHLERAAHDRHETIRAMMRSLEARPMATCSGCGEQWHTDEHETCLRCESDPVLRQEREHVGECHRPDNDR